MYCIISTYLFYNFYIATISKPNSLLNNSVYCPVLNLPVDSNYEKKGKRPASQTKDKMLWAQRRVY